MGYFTDTQFDSPLDMLDAINEVVERNIHECFERTNGNAVGLDMRVGTLYINTQDRVIASNNQRSLEYYGVYFISKENEGSLMKPYPVLFNDVSEYQIQYVHPLPDNEVIKIDNAGFGFVLMHKSIVPKIREANPGKGMFVETGDGDDDHFIGEDIIFFRRMKAANVPLHAHTGAIVKHMKRFSLDYDYYALYWANEHLKNKLKEQQGE